MKINKQYNRKGEIELQFGYVGIGKIEFVYKNKQLVFSSNLALPSAITKAVMEKVNGLY